MWAGHPIGKDPDRRMGEYRSFDHGLANIAPQAGEQWRGTALGPYGYPQGNYVQIGRPSERDPAA